jgi:hypothetical protein
MKDQSRKTSRDEEEVLTPGGRRHRKLVHFVRSGEAVRFDEKGNFNIISPIQPLNQKRSLLMTQNLVLTPGGYRDRQLVHHIEPGHVLQISRQRLRMVNPVTKSFFEIPKLILQPGDIPGFGTGWITYTYWTNNTGNPISSFRTSWRVPQAPKNSSGQTIFLFNGIDPSNPSAAILQPVLQWGVSAAGGGPYWSVASWYVQGNGVAIHTDLVQVNEDDDLLGLMMLTGKSESKFSYTAEFYGINNTTLPVQNVDELVWCNETLEAYDITSCSDYPNNIYTAMHNVQIETGNSTPALNWTPVDRVTDCGQHATVVSNSATDGEVDLFYGPSIGVIAPYDSHILERKVTDLSKALAHLDNPEDWRELIMILHRPGWTTPAEYIFASGILTSMLDHTEALAKLKKQLLEGSNAVIAK